MVIVYGKCHWIIIDHNILPRRMGKLEGITWFVLTSGVGMGEQVACRQEGG